MRYLPYDETRDKSNIIVDGAVNECTVLSLSHWQGNNTPVELKADLSAEIVFNYLDNPQFAVEVECVSNNHFDEDGLISVFSLLEPEWALENRELLIDVARAGDFGKYQDRDAARICFILQNWQHPDRSPLKKHLFFDPAHDITSILYEELLPRLTKIVEKIDWFEKLWTIQDAQLTRTEIGLQNGTLELEELPELDLAIVTSRSSNPREKTTDKIHRFAIHNATDMSRIMLLAKEDYRVYYRYESWIELISRQAAPRLDLSPLAEELTKLEAYGQWSFDGCEKTVPNLRLNTGITPTLERDKFRELVIEYLRKTAS